MWVARCSVRVGVINHEPCPLRHLAEVAVRVVEILHGGQVGLGAQHHRELEAGLVAEDAGQDGDVAGLVEHGLAAAVAGGHVADDLARVLVPELLAQAAGAVAVGRHHQRRDGREVAGHGRGAVIGGRAGVLQPHVLSLEPDRHTQSVPVYCHLQCSTAVSELCIGSNAAVNIGRCHVL